MSSDSTKDFPRDRSPKDVLLISTELAQRLKAVAAEEGCNVHQLTHDVLTLWLDEREGPIGDVQLAFALASLPRPSGATP